MFNGVTVDNQGILVVLLQKFGKLKRMSNDDRLVETLRHNLKEGALQVILHILLSDELLGSKGEVIDVNVGHTQIEWSFSLSKHIDVAF